MYKAILFDLDGTLLPMDTDTFLQQYTSAIAAKVAHIIDPKIFIRHLMGATEKMIWNTNPNHTNSKVFWEHFSKRMGEKLEELIPLIDDFYQQDFPKLGKDIKPKSTTAKIIRNIKDQGYKLVLATNAVFPEKAIVERIRWASLNPRDFNLITAYENMHFCKPHLGYYREISDKIGEKPEDCLMVGNDMEEDMIASKIGMKTFLVEDFIINRKGINRGIHYRGTLDELFHHLEQL